MKQLTREEKVKRILQVATGTPPKDLDNDRVTFWEHWQSDEYKAVIDGKVYNLTKAQYEIVAERIGGKHLVMTLAEGCEPLNVSREEYEKSKDNVPQGTYTVRPDQEEPLVQEEMITEDIEAEIVEVAAGPAQPLEVAGKIDQTYKQYPFEEMNWQDCPMNDRINFMFPRQRG